ncbi:MAG: DUF2807 domain-containing protein [candidate division Zixibacteria bacterium]|nr:DUF2807 domain-containing protein [candidate division Zixibacteria bacterium]MDH3936703.1 DUF2807 domain-containing protein [candidate division Zixibacteria bacterium]
MFNRVIRPALSIAILLLASCSSDDNPLSGGKPTVTGSGNLITESRTLEAFTSVVMNTVGDVDLDYGTQTASITVDDNIMPFIIMSVSQDVLTIDSDRSKNLREFDLTVNLTMAGLEGLTLAGVGNIRATHGIVVSNTVDLLVSGVGEIDIKLVAPDVTATMSGVGGIELTGNALRYTAIMSGTGSLKTFNFGADTATVTLSGVGDAEVWVNQVLTAVLTGQGSIYYHGHPTIHQTVTGLGQLVDAN